MLWWAHAECVLSREGVRGADATQIEAMLTNTDGYVVAGSEDGRVVFWDLVEEKMVMLCISLFTHCPVHCLLAVALAVLSMSRLLCYSLLC